MVVETGVRMRRFSLLVLFLALLSVALPATAYAADYHVAVGGHDITNTGQPWSPFASVQRAVDAAFATGGGNVYVGAGTFTGNVTLRNGVSLYGAGADKSTLAGAGAGSVVTINNIGAGETVSGFTITGGVAQQGGGIYIMSSSPTISSNVITGNTVHSTTHLVRGQGGGIYCESGSPTIANNTIELNAASGRDAGGGGIALASSSAIVRENTIRLNTMVSSSSSLSGGGGVHSRNGSPLLVGNVIEDNVATGFDPQGGGINLWAGAAVVIGNSIIGNQAGDGDMYGKGGGVYCFNSASTISGNLIAENVARADRAEGAGIHFYAGFDVLSPVIADNTITGNRCEGNMSNGAASGGGLYLLDGTAVVRGNRIAGNVVRGRFAHAGGIYTSAFWNPTSPVLINNVIAGNSLEGAYAGGSAIWCETPALRITNTTIVGNTLAPGASMTNPSVTASGGSYGSSMIITNSILWNNQPSQLSGGTVTYSCVQGGAAGDGNISANPLLTARYALSAGSPASDVASPTIAPATDIVGTARPQGAGFDMGAFEYTPLPLPPVTASNDAYTVAEDTLLTVAGRGVLANDSFTTDQMPLAATVLGVPVNGTLTLRPDGSFTYAPTADWSGTDTFTYTATDRHGVTDSATVTITVQAVNDAPVLAPIGSKSVDERASLVFTASTTDVDTPQSGLTYSLGAGAPAGATINATTGSFMWTPTEAQGPGTYQIQVIVSDGALLDSEIITVDVAEVASAPVLLPIIDRSVDELAPLVVTAVAMDEDIPADTLTFSLAPGAPAGAFINPATGTFYWTPTEAQGPGVYDIGVVVSDGARTDSRTFRVTVAEVATAPVLDAIADVSVDESATLDFIATASDVDLPAQSLTFSLGAGAPDGAAIDPAIGAFSWTPTEAHGPGAYMIAVVVSDGALTAVKTFTVTVAEVASAPVLAPIGTKTVQQFQPLSFSVEATDTDLPAETLTFGLAPGAPAGAAINAATGAFSWTPGEGQGPGTYSVTVLVSDGVLTDSETFSITVTAVPVAPAPVPASSVSAPAAQKTSSSDADDAESTPEDAQPALSDNPNADTPEEESGDGDDAEEAVTVLETLPATGATLGLQPWLLWALLALAALGVGGWLLRRKTTPNEA